MFINGSGRFIWNDGEEIQGTFVESQVHGNGSYKFSNGDKY